MRTSRIFRLSLVFALAIAAAWPAVTADAGTATIEFQGCLTDSTGAAVADGPHAVRLGVYAGADTPDPLWRSDGLINVNVSRGCFRHALGTSNPLPESLFVLRTVWVGIGVGTGPEQQPRMLLELPGAEPGDVAAQAAGSDLTAARVEPSTASPTVSTATPSDVATAGTAATGPGRRLPMVYLHLGGSFGLGSMARGDVYKQIVDPFKPTVGGGYTLGVSVGFRNIYQFQYRPRAVGSVNLFVSDFDVKIPMDIHFRDVLVHKLNLLAFKKPSRNGEAATLFVCYGTAGKGKVRHVDEVGDGFLGGSDRMLGVELGILNRVGEASVLLERHVIKFSSFDISGLGSYVDEISASYWYFALQLAFGTGI